MQPNELESLVKLEQQLFYKIKAEEYQPDKRKLIEERGKVLTKIKEIRVKMDVERRKGEEEWKRETVKAQLPNFRFAFGDAVPHLMHGEYTQDVLAWTVPTNTEIEVNKRKVDLLKLLSPVTVRHLIDHPLSPVFFELEVGGAFQSGKRLGYYVSGEWEKTRGITIKSSLFLALMKV
jgi:hypothetical protein